MKILVTGCAGFIGAHLVKKLLEKKYRVVGIDNLNDYYSPKLKRLRLDKLIGPEENFRFYPKDITNLRSLTNLFKNFRFDLVVHLAAQAGIRHSLINPYSYEKNNLAGLLNVLETIKSQLKKPKLIFASSSSVYGGSRRIPFEETDPCNQPLSLYGATKRAGELMIQSYHYLFDIQACCLRFFTVYGPWGRPDMAYYSFVEKLYNRRPITLYQKDTKRDFTYIDDIVRGIELAIDKPFRFGIINLGNSRPVPLENFVKILEKETGKKATIKLKKLPKTDLKITYADITRAKKILGWQPQIPLEEGLKKFVAWYKTEIRKIS